MIRVNPTFRFTRATARCLIAAALLMPATHADEISERAHKLHFSSIVLDTHDDTTQRFFSKDYDIGKRNPSGHVDIPRMREGGMNAIFFSIWIDGRIMGPPAVQKALDQIDAVHENVKKNSKDMVLALTAADVRRAHADGTIAALMGVEGGHMIGNDIRMVRIFADLGVRYMTLSHFYNDEWADSSTDKPAHNGLTDFGKDVVREMNRQGMMVDISHVSDKTFYDALEVSKAPLIASHSSCRAICNHVRNMSDDMLRAIAGLMTRGLRSQDQVGRYGGEEFAIMLPETSLECARDVLERTRQGIAELRHDLGGHKIAVTVSVGVVSALKGESIEAALARADKALYRAKGDGRNRVIGE